MQGLNQTGTFSSNFNLLEIIMLGGILANTTVSFQFEEFLTPNTIGTHDNIDFYILDSNLGFMAQKRNISYQLFQANRIKNFSYVTLNSATNQKTSINFTVTPLSFVAPNATINLQFPTEFSLASKINYFLFVIFWIDLQNISWNGIKNIENPSFIADGNSIQIKNFNRLYIESDFISFCITNIINPMIAFSTSSFQISLIDVGGSVMEKISDKLPYTVTSSSLTNVIISPLNILTDSLVNLTISFNKSNMLNSMGFFVSLKSFTYFFLLATINIDFPTNFDLSNVQSVVAYTGVSKSLQYSIQNNSIIISHGFTDTDAVTFVSFQIANVCI